MQEEGTEAKSIDGEETTVDQQTAVTVSDTGAEAPSSSTVAPSTSLNNDEIANGYRYGSRESLITLSSLSQFLKTCSNVRDSCTVIDYIKASQLLIF